MSFRIPLAIAATLVCAVLAWVVWANDSSEPESATTETAQKGDEGTGRSSRPNPVFDVGQTVYITEKGFEPKQLVSIVDRPIEWVNETNEPRRLDFVTTRGPSPRIAPGDSWKFTPTSAVSIAYNDARDRKRAGSVQVEPLEPTAED